MELKVYDGEYFERGKTRYIIFVVVILAVIVLSILGNNIAGGVIVLLFASGYLYFSLKTNKPIVISVGKKVLQIGRDIYQWGELKGFVVEYDNNEKKKIHNLVIIDRNNKVKIYTINDTNKNVEEFIDALNSYIPMMENYEQSTFDRIIRKLKL